RRLAWAWSISCGSARLACTGGAGRRPAVRGLSGPVPRVRRRGVNYVRIVSADVSVSSPGRNYTTLVIRTDEGVLGLGDATLNGRELAVASYLSEHVAPLLIGRDAHQIEDTWQYLYRGAYWRR